MDPNQSTKSDLENLLQTIRRSFRSNLISLISGLTTFFIYMFILSQVHENLREDNPNLYYYAKVTRQLTQTVNT